MVIPMKKARIYAPKSERGALLTALQRHSIVMLTELDGAVPDAELEKTRERLDSAASALRFTSRYREKKGLFAQPTQISYEALLESDSDAETLALEAEAAALAAGIAAAEKDIAANAAAIDSLRPWRALGFALGDIADTRFTRALSGLLPRAAADTLELPNAAVALGEGNFVARTVVVYCHCDDYDSVYQSLKDAGFSESAPPDYSGAAELEIERLELTNAALREQLESLRETAAELAARADALEVLSDSLSSEAGRRAVPYAQTESVFYIEGWLPAEKQKKLASIVEKNTSASEIEFLDPAEDEQPPTLVRNNRFITPFESITDMYSRPDPRGVDPNPVMGPWYWIIFGMMMADVGYGLIMIAAFSIFKALKKPKGNFRKLVDVLLFSGFTTVFWGVMFGGYFGEQLLPAVLLVPLDDPLVLMVLCMGVGLLHIFTGMIIKIVLLVKEGKWLDALFDQVSWMLLLCGLVLLVLAPTAGAIAAGVGAATILFTAGRDKKGIGKVTGGLLGLYDITAYLSDIISYSRIMALMLSSGIIAMVMNVLAGMVQGSVFGFIVSIVIYFVGHVFNLAMGLLSAYIHASRLQYIEFFSRFYDGGGYEFRPLSPETKYVEVQPEPND